MRRFRYSGAVLSPLQQNAAHQFAARHALVHYLSGAVCTFIPKNGCSTLRVSLAIGNGCIEDMSQFNWIHNNNATFIASLAELVRSSYTFVVLRCPYARLASAYLDKIVGHTQEAWSLFNLLDRDRELNAITFEEFVHLMRRRHVLNGNIHWRPQSDFLVYAKYDDYFRVDALDEAKEVVSARCGLELVDARPLTRHGLDQVRAADDMPNPHRMAPVELLAAKTAGVLPCIETLYTEELRSIVRQVFAQDIELFQSKFGSHELMFRS